MKVTNVDKKVLLLSIQWLGIEKMKNLGDTNWLASPCWSQAEDRWKYIHQKMNRMTINLKSLINGRKIQSTIWYCPKIGQIDPVKVIGLIVKTTIRIRTLMSNDPIFSEVYEKLGNKMTKLNQLCKWAQDSKNIKNKTSAILQLGKIRCGNEIINEIWAYKKFAEKFLMGELYKLAIPTS